MAIPLMGRNGLDMEQLCTLPPHQPKEWAVRMGGITIGWHATFVAAVQQANEIVFCGGRAVVVRVGGAHGT
jgi:hypothetical protein